MSALPAPEQATTDTPASPMRVHVEAEVPHPTASPDWERWRGHVDGTLTALPEAVKQGFEGLGRQMGQMETNVNGQLTEVTRRLGEVEHQTKVTNGRVNAHDVELGKLQTREETLEEADSRDRDADKDRRYSRNALIASIAGGAGAVGGLLAGLSALGVHI